MESSIKTGYYRAFLLFLIGKILTNHSRECIKSAIFDIISPLYLNEASMIAMYGTLDIPFKFD